MFNDQWSIDKEEQPELDLAPRIDDDELQSRLAQEQIEERPAKVKALADAKRFVASEVFKAGLKAVREESDHLLKRIIYDEVETSADINTLLSLRGQYRGLNRFEQLIQDHIEELEDQVNQTAATTEE